MEFEATKNDSGEYYAKDYSGYGNDGTVIGATWNATGGHDVGGVMSLMGLGIMY